MGDKVSVREVTVATQFRGPPNSGNGGYVSGLLAGPIPGPVTAVLRAPVPLDIALVLTHDDGVSRLTTAEGDLIGEARSGAEVTLPDPPPAPGLDAAQAAGETFVGLQRSFHPVCFTCGDKLAAGYGLRVFVGQLPGAPEGVVAGVWTPHADFADPEGLAPLEVVWAALDCPGSVAWVVQGGGGGLLGTMTAEVRRRPKVGEACIVMAWPVERSGRKSLSGTALFSAEGELMARSLQIWIGRAPSPTGD